jgi:hypothetical protein
MEGFPRVVTSGARIATVDGTDVRVLTVELWNPEQVTVRLVGDLDDRTWAALVTYREALERWTPERGRDALPVSPGEALHDALDVRLTDAWGTDYRCESASSGGTGRELLCEWHFRASSPLPGDHLTLTVTSVDGTAVTMAVSFTA